MITPLIADKLKLIEGEYPSDWILKAFKVAAGNNARNINYIEACLKNMRDKGVDWKPGGNGAGKKKEEVKSADYISGQYAGFIEH